MPKNERLAKRVTYAVCVQSLLLASLKMVNLDETSINPCSRSTSVCRRASALKKPATWLSQSLRKLLKILAAVIDVNDEADAGMLLIARAPALDSTAVFNGLVLEDIAKRQLADTDGTDA
mmetsp:Transcript_24902/g.63412  ORF Transcript_24902/g.63412 Transcript_24902/m.63412 type:complete len:120 (-) Transcript_24902:140-499(-)